MSAPVKGHGGLLESEKVCFKHCFESKRVKTMESGLFQGTLLPAEVKQELNGLFLSVMRWPPRPRRSISNRRTKDNE